VAELLRGDGEVRVRCDEPERAAVAARAVAGEATVTADGLRVALAEEAVPELVAALVAAGVRVREVVRERRTLEEFFLGVTGQQEAAL
jgi:ABC-2 type transport system ATP-binding protein